MPARHDSIRTLASEDWSRLEDAIHRFVETWRQGLRPIIDDYLPDGEPLQLALLIELVHTELELRLKAGESARVEEYLDRYPQLATNRVHALELIGTEYELRRRGEPALSLDEYLQRFPLYGADLPEQITCATVLGSGGGRGTPNRQANLRAEAPPEVPGYKILDLLGRGGMGVVYRARQLSLNRLVALKVLPATCAQDPLWLARFRHEARTASALNHPHICTIYDTGDCAGRPFLSMELIEGRTLEALIGQRPPVKEVVVLIAQAARALAAAHAAGVVHRDIKPANLMVRDDWLVKVLDFGLARRLQAPGTSEMGTDPGTRVGTLLYMSPEQARAEPVGTATDIFALGLVLYELATGQHPFQADTEFAILTGIVSYTPVPPARLNPEIAAPLEALILRMLAKDPRLRPSAPEVVALLADRGESVRSARSSPSAGAGKRPTVGRQQERATLCACFEAAAAGRGSLLCITGEPGLGKTTVVEDFLEELAESGVSYHVARGRCSERLAGTEAYLPFLEALDSLLQGDGGAQAAQVMKLLAPTWYVQVAPLAAGEASPTGALAEVQGASQERRKREFAVFLGEVARLRPLVLFLDDVHWADPSSVDLLAYLGGKCSGLRLLVVLTYRPADLLLSKHLFGPVQLELQGRGLCREVALPFLSRADLDRYLALAFAGHSFPEEFAAAIHTRTGGNPLYMVELLRYLRDRGILVQQPGGWTVAALAPDFRRELPESVRSMIQRKVDQLAEADRHLLLAASVQGLEFDSAVVARVLGREAAEVEERLHILERVHALVRLVREQEFPDGTLTVRYRFVHILYQNALYESLLPTRKVAWSAAAARALLAHHGEKSAGVAHQLALLFEAARDPGQAVAYFLLAARQAVQLFAHREAATLARRGLDLLARLPATSARTEQELPLRLALGVSLVATRGFASPEVEQVYQRAHALCSRGTASQEDITTLFPVLYGLWNVALLRCELDRCKELATEMFSLAQEQSDPVFLLEAHNVLQQPLLHLGEYAEARRHQEEGLALYDPQKHQNLTAVYGEDPGVSFLAYGAVTLWARGYPEQAARSVRAAWDLAETQSNPFNQARALYFGAFTHVCRREVRLAQELAGALMGLAREHGFELLGAGGMILQGWSLTVQGQREEGLRPMRQGLADWLATGALSHRPYQLALLAEALARQGQTSEARSIAAEAVALATSTGERFLEAELHRLYGEIVLRGAETERSAAGTAEACFRRALEVARRQGARSLELRALMSLHRLHRLQGRGAESVGLLSETYGWFREGFDTLDLQEAKALLGGG